MKQVIYPYVFAVALFLMFTVLGYAANPDQDLLLYLPFDEGKGEEVGDVSPNGFVGTVKNGEWVEGVVEQALHLNNGVVTFEPLGIDSPKEMTIEFWFKPDAKIDGGGRIDLLYRLSGGGASSHYVQPWRCHIRLLLCDTSGGIRGSFNLPGI